MGATNALEKVSYSSGNVLLFKLNNNESKNKELNTIKFISNDKDEFPEDKVEIGLNKNNDNPLEKSSEINVTQKDSSQIDKDKKTDLNKTKSEIQIAENNVQKKEPVKAKSTEDKTAEVGNAIKSTLAVAATGLPFGPWGIAAGFAAGLLINAPTISKCARWLWNKIK